MPPVLVGDCPVRVAVVISTRLYRLHGSAGAVVVNHVTGLEVTKSTAGHMYPSRFHLATDSSQVMSTADP